MAPKGQIDPFHARSVYLLAHWDKLLEINHTQTEPNIPKPKRTACNNRSISVGTVVVRSSCSHDDVYSIVFKPIRREKRRHAAYSRITSSMPPPPCRRRSCSKCPSEKKHGGRRQVEGQHPHTAFHCYCVYT